MSVTATATSTLALSSTATAAGTTANATVTSTVTSPAEAKASTTDADTSPFSKLCSHVGHGVCVGGSDAKSTDAKQPKEANGDIQHKTDPHELVISGKTCEAFVFGIDTLIQLGKEFHLERYAVPLQEMITKITEGSTLKIPAQHAYSVGFALCQLLHAIEQIIQMLMRKFEQPPKIFSDWKTSSDTKCRETFASVTKATHGLCALRGYADYIVHHAPMFECTLSASVLAGVTRKLPAIVTTPKIMNAHGMFYTASPEFAIIGDCNPEFWCTEADRNQASGYVGLKRDCSHF